MERPGKSLSSFIISLLFASSLLTLSLMLPSRAEAEGSEIPSGGIPGSGVVEKQYSIDGYFLNEYRYRGTQVSGESLGDQDITAELRFDVTMPEKNRFEFHFFGTANGDLDGERENQNFYPLEDITDTSSSWVYATLYEAHFDINYALPFIRQLRIGRQAGTRSVQMYFDGVASDFDVAERLSLTVYGGVAVHFFEIDSSWGSDALAGIGADYYPFDATTVQRGLSLYTGQQDRLSGNGPERPHRLLQGLAAFAPLPRKP